jgi:hypothetical protein
MSLLGLLRAPDAHTLRRFVETWHGPPTHGTDRVEVDALPPPLAELAAIAVAWPSAIVQNELVLDPEPMANDGRRLFYVENQGVYLWAIDPRGPDPVVWGRFNDTGEPWLAEREPLSRFVVQVALFEAIFGAPHGASAAWVALPQLELVVSPMELLPFGSWRWPSEPSWFYAGADILCFACPNSPQPRGPTDQWSVAVAARTAEPVAYLRQLTGIRWDREPV